MEDIFIPP